MSFNIGGNISSLRAITYLNLAQNQAKSAIHRLASGNAIDNSGVDPSGLALGSILNSNIATMNAGLSNISQADSLLGTADGGLAEIGTLLLQQKALAVQSSGAITDSDRVILNQTFQSLSEQIDRIANTTTFNSKKLIDGSLQDASLINAASQTDATQAQATAVIVTAHANGESIQIGSTSFSFVNNAGMSGDDTDYLKINVTTYTTADTQAQRLADQVSYIKNYNGTNATVLTAKANLGTLDISKTATATLSIESESSGTAGNAVVVQSTAAAASFTLDSVNAGGSAGRTLGSAGFIATDGDLSSGAFSTGSTAFSGSAKVIATGTIGDSLLKSINTTSQSNTGIDVSNISNNPDFIGTISGFTATYSSSQLVNLSITIGTNTYTANSVRTDYSADTKVTLTSQTDGGGSFTIQISGGNGEASVANQNDANIFATRLDNAFSSVTISQKRDLDDIVGATVYPTSSSTASGDLSGSRFQLISSNFTNNKFEDVRVTSSSAGEAVIEVVIDGETYRSGYNSDGSVYAIGNSITSTEGTGADGKIGLVNQSNPNKILIWDYASATNLSISTVSEAEGLEVALKNAFGIGSTSNSNNNGMSFQVGLKASDIINVNIGGANTNHLFVNSGGAYQSISIDTQSESVTAQTILDNAIVKLNTIRANVGATQSQFSSASSNLNSSIINFDAARSMYLDTDYAKETANLAQAQLKYQSAIAAVTHNNNLNSSLLKLINNN